MKVSLAWMQQIAVNNRLPTDRKAIIKRIGAQLGAIEQVIDLTPIYVDVVIVKLISVKPIEGSDHLHVCLIDDGNTVKDVERTADNLIQVVCGAPNVSPGKMAVWLPPGSTVPASIDKQPFKLSARQIMGFKSNGMLASARELAIGDDHDGIVLIDDDVTAGEKFSQYLKLDDLIIDIENKMFTHRPDLFGQLGVARELCGIFDLPFTSPLWYGSGSATSRSGSDQLIINNELLSEGCPRYTAAIVNNLTVGPSPLWLQSFLSRTGIRQVNNIVDVTNYVMMVTGQPMHAYDRSKLTNAERLTISIRHPKQGERLELLDGSSIELADQDIVIADHDQAIGLGGIMGGKASEVDEHTTDVLLECASFDMYSIRRSAMRHGVFSEAVTRFSKGQSPEQCLTVMTYALDLLNQICPAAELSSKIADTFQSKPGQHQVSVDLPLLETYLGLKVEPDELLRRLNNVELNASIDGDRLNVMPPFWRTDIQSTEDIIEEVARLIGFDNLPLAMPLRSLNPPEVPRLIELKGNIRSLLAGTGSNEVLTYSFIDSKLMKITGQAIDRAFKLSNAVSPELQYYRCALLPSLLDLVHKNHKAGYGRFSLFENGKIHFNDFSDDDGLPLEIEALALVVSADRKSADEYYNGPAFYQARALLDYLLKGIGISHLPLRIDTIDKIKDDPLWRQFKQLFDGGRSAVVKLNDDILGVIGEFASGVSRGLKLPEYCAGFEINLAVLGSYVENEQSPYQQLSRFPKVWQDLTITKPISLTYQSLVDKLTSRLQTIVDKDLTAKLYPIDSYQSSGSDSINWTFRLEVGSQRRTLTDQEVTSIIEALQQV